MDPILGGYIRDYLEKHGLQSIDQGQDFERFANHCVIARDFPSITDSNDIAIGGSFDTGIDGIAIFANGIHIDSIEALEYLANRTRINIDFVFIQSKSSQKISATEVGNFGEGVYSFFADTGMRENPDIEKLKSI